MAYTCYWRVFSCIMEKTVAKDSRICGKTKNTGRNKAVFYEKDCGGNDNGGQRGEF